MKKINFPKINYKKINFKKVLLVMVLFVCCYFFGGGIAMLTNAYEKDKISEKNAIIESNGENWGLGFQTEGQPPVGNVSSDELKEHDAYYIGDVNQNMIYLTFDAGYENGYTEVILDALKKHNVPATFFLVGNYLETSPDLVKRMVNEGHVIGNHTYSHPNMAKISSIDVFRKELEDLEVEYENITGQKMMKYYRPPQGIYSEDNLKMANDLGYKTFFWSLAYADWHNDKQPSKEEAFDKLLGRIHPGAIVLLHSTSKTNSEILDELLEKWKEMGYTFRALEEIK